MTANKIFKMFTFIFSLFIIIPMFFVMTLENSIGLIVLKLVLSVVMLFVISSAFYSWPHISLGPYMVYLTVFTSIVFNSHSPQWLSNMALFFIITLIISQLLLMKRIGAKIDQKSDEI